MVETANESEVKIEMTARTDTPDRMVAYSIGDRMRAWSAGSSPKHRRPQPPAA